MQQRSVCSLTLGVALTLCWAGGAGAGAPDASLAGSVRGSLDVVLPYYPASARAAALGRATVALEGLDSHNPAALGFFKGYDLMADYGRANFGHGPDLDIYHGHLVFPMPGLGGTNKLMAFGISTRDEDVARMRGVPGVTAHVWARQLGLAYGREIDLPDQVPGRLALGFAGFPSDPSEIRLEAAGGGGRMAHGRGQSLIGSIRLGALYAPSERVALGGEFTHIKDRLYATYPGFQIPGRFLSNYHVNIWTLGAALRPIESTTVLVQYLFGHASGQGVDKEYAGFSAGVEHRVPVTDSVGLALRAGLEPDSPTFGLGVKLPARCRFDYAFIPHYGHNIRRAFGHAALHIFSFGKSF